MRISDWSSDVCSSDLITTLVETRLDLLARHRESLRRALALLALPTNLPFAARLGWRSADCMWRLAGDTATDYNHYSKRTILGTVYGSKNGKASCRESVGN